MSGSRKSPGRGAPRQPPRDVSLPGQGDRRMQDMQDKVRRLVDHDADRAAGLLSRWIKSDKEKGRDDG